MSINPSPHKRLRLSAALGVAAMLVFAAPAQADTKRVCNSGCGFDSIQAAVDAAGPGDTIEVAPGFYNELVTIDKRLELRGPQAGADARRRVGGSGGEAVLVQQNGDPAGFRASADQITIDGFRVQDNSGPGIQTGASTAGHRIVNNVITGNAPGIRLNGAPSATTRTFVQQNRIDANNKGGPGSGILSDRGVSNVEIAANLFAGQRLNGIRIAGPADAAELSQGIDIIGNKLDDDAGIFLQNARSATLLSNDSLQPGRVSFNGVDFGGNVNGAVVRANRFIAHRKRQVPENAVDSVFKDTGVLISNRDGLEPNGQIQVVGNTITDARRGISISHDPGEPEPQAVYAGELKVEFNRIVRNSRGLSNSDPDATELVDADNNWWGCNQGPNDATNRCENVGANVNFDPWLTLRVEAGTARLRSRGHATEIVAAVIRNSAGDAPVSFFPDRTTIGFEATKGRIRKRARTLEGVARTVFSTTSRKGSAKVTASLDNERKRAKIDIEGRKSGNGRNRDRDRDRGDRFV